MSYILYFISIIPGGRGEAGGRGGYRRRGACPPPAVEAGLQQEQDRVGGQVGGQDGRGRRHQIGHIIPGKRVHEPPRYGPGVRVFRNVIIIGNRARSVCTVVLIFVGKNYHLNATVKNIFVGNGCLSHFV